MTRVDLLTFLMSRCNRDSGFLERLEAGRDGGFPRQAQGAGLAGAGGSQEHPLDQGNNF